MFHASVGVSFVLIVATESLAVLAALLATDGDRSWLGAAALAPLLIGLSAYLFVLARIDLRQLIVGRGDHWVFGGALGRSRRLGGRLLRHARPRRPARRRRSWRRRCLSNHSSRFSAGSPSRTSVRSAGL